MIIKYNNAYPKTYIYDQEKSYECMIMQTIIYALDIDYEIDATKKRKRK